MTVHRYDPASMRLSLNGVEMPAAFDVLSYASKPKPRGEEMEPDELCFCGHTLSQHAGWICKECDCNDIDPIDRDAGFNAESFSVTLEGTAPRADFDAFLAQLGPPPPLLLDLRLKDRQCARRLRRALARVGCRGRRGAVAVDLARLPVTIEPVEEAGLHEGR